LAGLRLLTLAASPQPPRHHAEDTPVNQGQIHYPLVITAALFLFFYVGAEISFGGWVYTYAVTLKLASAAVAAYPDDANTTSMLGLLLVEQGKTDEAIAMLRRATEADPRYARAHYNLGLLLDRLGRAGEAEDALRRAAEIEPLAFDYLYALAEFYVRHGRAAEGRAAVERLLTAHPDNPTARELAAFVDRGRPAAGR